MATFKALKRFLGLRRFTSSPIITTPEPDHTVIIHNDVTVHYYKNMKHRQGAPAYMSKFESRWYYMDQLHNVYGPAITTYDDRNYWYYHHKLHRSDISDKGVQQPAVYGKNIDTRYSIHGKLHRFDDGPSHITKNGDKFWYMFDQLHREGNLPAVVTKDGTMAWYCHGRLNSVISPRFGSLKHAYNFPHTSLNSIYLMGSEFSLKFLESGFTGKKNVRGGVFYFKDGLLHRDGNMPAIEYNDGTLMYMQFGLLHNYKYPAIITNDGSKLYYYAGTLHNSFGPAVILANGGREWWKGGARHNENGPAVDYGSFKHYFLNGMYKSPFDTLVQGPYPSSFP